MSNHPNQHHTAPPTPMVAGPARKKVIILAMGSSRSDFDAMQLMERRPELLEGAEIWGINYMGAIKKLDRIIHVDPVHPYLGLPVVKEMCDFALKMGIPFYTSWPHERYTNHEVYPFDKIVERLGTAYINGSVAAALAMALAEGFTDIGMFGCDFSYPQAHLSEAGRANVEYLMGIGTQRGVKFYVAATSTLLDMYCQQQPYGFFANPNLPPNNGGKLMSTREIIEHCQRMRQRTLVHRPQVFAVATDGPSTVEPISTITAEHETVREVPTIPVITLGQHAVAPPLKTNGAGVHAPG